MTFDEIESVLGISAAQAVVDSIRHALEPRSIAAGDPQRQDAVEALLIALLAAVIITPKDGAIGRVEAAMENLEKIVTASLATRADDVPRGPGMDGGTEPCEPDLTPLTYWRRAH
ncbi:MAG TPA: hypothetical protein PK970_14170 [Hyphomicrobiaceae bacterium]|mgnify:CR=1 FL=1|nr:hypothetical protein [Hyphomicrobiaceae bacterium]